MHNPIKTDLSLVFATIIWGSTFPVIQICMYFIDPLPFMAVRFLAAGLILFVIFHGRIRTASLKLWRDGAIIGVILTAANYLQYEGIKYTSASNSAFISSISVLLVPVMVAVLSKKLPRFMVVIGVLTASVGMVFVCGIASLDFSVPPFIHLSYTPLNFGDMLTFFCAILYAVYLIVCDNFASKHDPISLNAVHLAACGFSALIIWPMLPGQRADFFHWEVILLIIYCATFASALAYLLMLRAQKYATPTHVALIFALEPVFAAIFATIIPDMMGNVELMTVSSVVGSSLIVIGIVVSEFKRRNKTGLPPPGGLEPVLAEPGQSSESEQEEQS